MGGKLPPFSVTEEDGVPLVWQPWQIKFSNGTLTDNGDGTVSINISANTGGAPTGATYITQTPHADLSGEQALNQLITGLLKNTSGTGVLSVGSGGVDYENIISAGSPVLRKANLIYLLTDGTATNFLNGAGNWVMPVEARSPLLKAGSILSIVTDGTTTNYLRGDGTWAVPTSNGGIKQAFFTIGSDNSWDGEQVPVFQAPYDSPITLKRIEASVIGSNTCQLIFNLDMRVATSLNTIGVTKVFAANQSAVTAGFSTVSFSSANIPALMYLVLSTPATAAAGVPDLVSGSIFYTRDSI